jgi:rhodanese-related sulfurtransferase
MHHAPRFLALVDAARTRVREVDAATVRTMIETGEPVRIVDVREESEAAAGRVPGAVHLGKGVIERDIESVIPDTDTEIVLYCRGGYRSILAADAIQRMGYTNVRSMAGGWRAWTEAGYPVED